MDDKTIIRLFVYCQQNLFSGSHVLLRGTTDDLRMAIKSDQNSDPEYPWFRLVVDIMPEGLNLAGSFRGFGSGGKLHSHETFVVPYSIEFVIERINEIMSQQHK